MSWLDERVSRLKDDLFGSIRARLLWFLFAGLGAALVALLLVLDFGVDRQIYGRLDHSLLGRARGVIVLLERHPAPEAIAELKAISAESNRGGHADLVQVWDDHGRTLLRPADRAGRGLARPDVSIPADAPYFYDVRLPDGHNGRAVALRFAFGDPYQEALLVMAEERDQVDALERQVHAALVAGVLGTSLIAALLGFLAVRGGLRPLLDFGARAGRRERAGADALPVAQMPSELRPFAEALNRAFADLHDAVERERRFARDVAHELRTPLAEMRMAIDLAQSTAPDPAPLHRALDSLDRMRRCVDGLLALSRYESGVDHAHIEPLDLAALVRRSLAMAGPRAREREVALETVIAAERWVMSDPALLERIVDNLLLNAIEYAPARSAVQVAVEDEAGGARLSIANAAPDLAPSDLPRFGERFWRKSPAREATLHGGLGLALSATLARLLGLELRFALVKGSLRATLAPLAGLEDAPADS